MHHIIHCIFYIVDTLSNLYQVLLVFFIALILFIYLDLPVNAQMGHIFRFVAYELRIVWPISL